MSEQISAPSVPIQKEVDQRFDVIINALGIFARGVLLAMYVAGIILVTEGASWMTIGGVVIAILGSLRWVLTNEVSQKIDVERVFWAFNVGMILVVGVGLMFDEPISWPDSWLAIVLFIPFGVSLGVLFSLREKGAFEFSVVRAIAWLIAAAEVCYMFLGACNKLLAGVTIDQRIGGMVVVSLITGFAVLGSLLSLLRAWDERLDQESQPLGYHQKSRQGGVLDI